MLLTKLMTEQREMYLRLPMVRTQHNEAARKRSMKSTRLGVGGHAGNPTGSRAATFFRRTVLNRRTCELRRIHWIGRVQHVELRE
jgi:hypothetical protein